MHRRNKLLALLFLFAAALLVSCASPPRTSTPAERDTATFALTQADAAIVVLQGLGRVTPEAAQLAHQQVATLRAEVAASETTPVNWLDLLSRIEVFALQWVLPPNTTAPATAPAPGSGG